MKFSKQLGILAGFILLVCLTSLNNVSLAFGPTIPVNGTWNSVSSFQVAQVKIDDKNERVCLPRIMFSDEVDSEFLKNQLKKGINEQQAIFHLYHDGLGKPKKQGGLYYASDVYLKDIKMTYTGYLRKLGYKFKVSKTPAFEDKDYMRDVLYSKHLTTIREERIKEEKNKRPAAATSKKPDLSTIRVTTIYDVLPKGVIPPSIRAKEAEIDRRIRALKNRPYDGEIVEVNPVRWAAGKMGLIKEDGTISGAFVEGQKPEMKITPPKEKSWLTPELLKEINGLRCEFVIQRDINGLEVKEKNKLVLIDLYFEDLKLSWEEWLQKKGLTFKELEPKPTYATTTVKLQVEMIKGTWNKLYAPALCSVKFAKENDRVKPIEIFRFKPADTRPGKFRAFAKKFNQKYFDKEVSVTLLVCPDGRNYHELGQSRAQRIGIAAEQDLLRNVIDKIARGKL